ncbi:MAG: DMT family transporter [Bacteroidales bacterium]
MQKNKNLLPYLALFIAMLFWGFSFIWTKLLLREFKPLTIITLRLIISSFFLIIFGILSKKLMRIKLADLNSFLLLSFFQPFLYFVGETIGLSYVSATLSSVLIATIPLFSPFAAWLIFRNGIKIINIIGIVISITGVYLVFLSSNNHFNASFTGILLMALAVFSAVSYTVLVINIAKKYNVYTIITWQNSIGIILFIPFFLIFEFKDFRSVTISFEMLKPLLALSIFASSLAFMFYTFGIRELGIVKANSMSNLIPVFTALFSFLILDEKLLFVNVIGIVIVLLGLFLTQIEDKFKFQALLVPLKKIYKK